VKIERRLRPEFLNSLVLRYYFFEDTPQFFYQQFIRQIGAALGVSTFVLAATVGGFRLGLLLMIAVSAGTFACVLALPAHSLHDAHQIDALE
jgi:hypothetical protein